MPEVNQSQKFRNEEQTWNVIQFVVLKYQPILSWIHLLDKSIQ